jgi:hypothetical protein
MSFVEDAPQPGKHMFLVEPTVDPELSNLLDFKKPTPVVTAEQEVLNQVQAISSDIENIVILVHDKDGNVKIFHAVSEDVGLWPFIDAVRARITQHTLDTLIPPIPRTFA